MLDACWGLQEFAISRLDAALLAIETEVRGLHDFDEILQRNKSLF